MNYAFYIWSAYGAAALAIGGLVIHAMLDHRAQVSALERLEAAEAAPRDEAHG